MAINVYIKNKNTKIGKAFADYIGMQKTESYPNGNSGIARESLKGQLAELLPQCVVDKVAGNAWVCGSITIDPNKMTYAQKRHFLRGLELAKKGERLDPQYCVEPLFYMVAHLPKTQENLREIVGFLNRKLPSDLKVDVIFNGQCFDFKTKTDLFYQPFNRELMHNSLSGASPIEVLKFDNGFYCNLLGGLKRLNPNYDGATYHNASWKSGWRDVYYRQDLLESFDFGKLIKEIKGWKK